jgi:hypothetical protein
MEDLFEDQLKRTIHTEDGFIIDGRRTIVPRCGKRIPASELIGAKITAIYPESQMFTAEIMEKTIHASCNDNDGITIGAIEIDDTTGDTKAIKM